MSFPVSTLKANDRATLEAFDPMDRRQVLAINRRHSGEAILISLERSEITCWQQFLRLFGSGSLAHIDYSYNKVASYLNQYDWKPVYNERSEFHRIYLKVCQLANKGALYGKSNALSENVAVRKLEKGLEFTQFQGGRVLNRHKIMKTLNWNPCLQVRHAKAAVRYQLQNHNCIRIEDENQHALAQESTLSFEAMERMRIMVEQYLPEPQPKEVVRVVHAPCSHAPQAACSHSASGLQATVSVQSRHR